MQEPSTQVLTQPATELATQAATTRAASPAAQPVTQLATEGATQPSTRTLNQAATEPETEPVSQPVTQLATQPGPPLATEPGTQPGTGTPEEAPPPWAGSDDPLARRRYLHGLSEKIAEMSAHIDSATWRLLMAIAEYDRYEGWASDFRSCAHWLTYRCQLDMLRLAGNTHLLRWARSVSLDVQGVRLATRIFARLASGHFLPAGE